MQFGIFCTTVGLPTDTSTNAVRVLQLPSVIPNGLQKLETFLANMSVNRSSNRVFGLDARQERPRATQHGRCRPLMRLLPITIKRRVRVPLAGPALTPKRGMWECSLRCRFSKEGWLCTRCGRPSIIWKRPSRI